MSDFDGGVLQTDECDNCEDKPATETVRVSIGGVIAGPVFLCGDCAEEVVEELNCVKTFDYDVLGTDVWTVTVDYADHSIVAVERSFERQ